MSFRFVQLAGVPEIPTQAHCCFHVIGVGRAQPHLEEEMIEKLLNNQMPIHKYFFTSQNKNLLLNSSAESIFVWMDEDWLLSKKAGW
jgi:hypothetical protein